MRFLKWGGEGPPFCKIKSHKARLRDMEMPPNLTASRLELVQVHVINALSQLLGV